MPIIDRTLQAKRRKRVVELLKQGLTTNQIAERTGVGNRQILRIRKKLEESDATKEACCLDAESAASP
jgi:uncharacterized protein YerC